MSQVNQRMPVVERNRVSVTKFLHLLTIFQLQVEKVTV